MSTYNELRLNEEKPIPLPKSIAFLLIPKVMIGYIKETATIRQGLEKMRHHGYTAMPVISEDGKYVGTVNEGDFLWYLVNKNTSDLKTYEDIDLSEIVRTDWNTPVTIDVPLEHVLERVLDQNFVPVVDDRDMFMGIITRKSVLQYYQKALGK